MNTVDGMIMPVSMPTTGSMLPAGTSTMVRAAVVLRLLPGQDTQVVVRTAFGAPVGSNRGAVNNLRENRVDALFGVWASSIYGLTTVVRRELLVVIGNGVGLGRKQPSICLKAQINRDKRL